MKRRTALKAVGASILTGLTLTGTAAAADRRTADQSQRQSAADNEPEIVSFAPGSISYSEKEKIENKWDNVFYKDDGTVVISGSTYLPDSCSTLVVDSIESTESGDVVQLATKNTSDGVCAAVVTYVIFQRELKYDTVPDEVSYTVDHTPETSSRTTYPRRSIYDVSPE